MRKFIAIAVCLFPAIAGAQDLVTDLRQLCDHIGGRVSGSPQSARAVEWAAQKFREAGADTVRVETYTLPAYWRSSTATASCVSPATFPLRIAAAPLTASTPDAIEGTLVDFGTNVGNAKGKIAFVHSDIMKSLDDLFADYMRIKPLMEMAKKSGVSAMLLESSQARELLYRHPMSLNGTIASIPVAIVAHDQAERLSRLMTEGDVRVRLRLDNKIARNVTERNVIAEIRGSELPDEVVMIGAHLDSWDMGTGALDNGVNAATVIDILRQMKAAGRRPKRTIRFALFTGEEQGMIGSKEYVRAHLPEMSKVAMMLAIDIGSGKTTGFFLNGRDELRNDVEQALLPFYADVKSQANASDAIDGTDNFDFLLAGVPNLVANQDPVPYLPDYHAESDTFDKVDQKQAKENETIYAAVLWQFANATQRAPQQTRAEVAKLITDTHLDDQMKGFQQWEEWASGRRGIR
ncbi:MAG TPA: M20/M25/M40 family metallo-hydrolase [Thermoanaerobaculia bacterium]|jgi:Zn-dependent M28 family amino/carboxypeptidase|nr:M20/M25/M40 family metallo-hydrolase [Thermoanaerobaculia bacterium]